jgi:DNA topoisomerase-2
MDGLKISLRKILYSAFKKNLTTEIKVAQFTGYVSENSCYHHGEASLNQAIVGLAQNFVGSNNINLLYPSGQFGTRLQGGKDSASERYIFTYLNKITRKIFPEEDDQVLSYISDDGYPVEPQFYVPIIPMVLINGSKGIGTGFSTEILCYNPKDVITYLRGKLNGFDIEMDFIPYYDGFTGTIEKIQNNKFIFKGKYEKVGTDKIRVTELPVGSWTQDFKELIEQLQETTDKDGKKIIPLIKDYDDMSKDTTIDFNITFTKGKLDEFENIKLDNNCNGVEKALKLCSVNSTTNMNLFDANDKLKKYESVSEIIDDYFETRLHYYNLRKNKQVEMLERQLMVLHNKKKYIESILNDTIDLRKKKKEQIVDMLQTAGFDIIDDDLEFKYLLKMTMDSVTEDNINKLQHEFSKKEAELEEIKNRTISSMWLGELTELDLVYEEFLRERENQRDGSVGKVIKKSKTKSK